MVAVRFAAALAQHTDVASARAEVERLLDGVPATALGSRPEEIRRLARRALETAAAASRRRACVGERPTFDEHAVSSTLAAAEDVARAREASRVVVRDGHRLLAIGNAWGAAGLTAAVALAQRGFDPMGMPVFAAVVSAASGPVASTAIAMWCRSTATIRVNAAKLMWSTALEKSGFRTMGELNASRIALRAWERREEEAAVAEATAKDAADAWHAVAGELQPFEGPRLAMRLAEARAAQVVLLRAVLEEHRDRLDRAPTVDLRVVDPSPSGEHWLTRLRGRGLRLWTR